MTESAPAPVPRFYFLTCQFGAEKTAKAEVLETYPQLKFAFSRPGLVTFKESEEQARPRKWNAQWIFVRLWGISRGQATSAEAAQALVDRWELNEVPATAIQCFDRDTWVPGDEPEGFTLGSRCVELLDRWGVHPDPMKPARVDAQASKTKWTWIWIDPDRLFLGEVPVPGTELPPQGIHSTAGNLCPVQLDLRAPSRAYLKLAEAHARFFQKSACALSETSALEIGCSPGGATFWMLQQGMQVVGVDPKHSAPQIEAHPQYRHVLKLAKTLQESDLQGFNPHWIVMDINLKPSEAMDELAHVLRLLKKIHGPRLKLNYGFLTLKLNDWKLAVEIPNYLKRIESLGFAIRVRGSGVFQLASNRQEFGVVAPFQVR